MPVPATAESFPALAALPGVRAVFVTRQPGIDVAVDRETALARLQPAHELLISKLGFSAPAFAQQVHGADVAAVTVPGLTAGVDGLVTATAGLPLGIYVADCAAIFVVDPRRRAIALVHSGKKGTEANILACAVRSLSENFGSESADLVVVTSPCIRPPFYEVDFAATIASQASALGVGAYHDAGVCTSAHPDRYYSYRREQGRTGRMLALLALV